MFAINQKIRLTPKFETIQISEKNRFSLAIIYPLGWINKSTIYEFEDFPSNHDLLADSSEVIIPRRVQFFCEPSHLIAVMEGDNFAAELKFNTVKYLDVFNSIKLSRLTDTGFVVSEDECDRLTDALLSSISVSISPKTSQKHSGDVIEKTINLVSDALIDFWMGSTGCSETE